MRCTAKKLFQCAAEANVTLIVQVKNNQRTLLQRCQDIAAARSPRSAHDSHTTGRNRDERRTVRVFDPADDLAATPWQPVVATIIEVEREVFTRSAATGMLRKTAETAFYVSNEPVAAQLAATAIRAHWAIENTSHHTRDATMGEDYSRIRTQPGVFARLRSFAFNISKANRSATMSQDRYRAALAGVDNLLRFRGVAQR